MLSRRPTGKRLPSDAPNARFGARHQPLALVVTNYFLFLNKCPLQPPRRVLACDRCRQCLGGPGAGRKRRHRVYSSINNSLACAVSPPARGIAPRLSAGQRDASPGTLRGRKEEKKERRTPPSCRPGWTRGDVDPATCCGHRTGAAPWVVVFSLNTEIQGFQPLEGGQTWGGAAPLSLAQWSLGVCPPTTAHGGHLPNPVEEKGGKPRASRLPGDGKET